MVSPTEIYLTGGINKALNDISNKAMLYNPQNNTCKVLPDMINIRYTHAMAYVKGRLYVLGGRTFGLGKSGIMHDCEFYDTINNYWVPITNMRKRRCTFFTVVYKDILYAIGGYTDEKKRSKVIERYID